MLSLSLSFHHGRDVDGRRALFSIDRRAADDCRKGSPSLTHPKLCRERTGRYKSTFYGTMRGPSRISVIKISMKCKRREEKQQVDRYIEREVWEK